MIRQIRKISAIIFFLLTGFSLIYIFFPETNKKINKWLSQFNQKAKTSQLWQKNKKTFTNVLGEKTAHQEEELSQEKLINQLRDIKTQVVSQKFIEETNKKINQLVNEKMNQIKKVPEKQIEQLRKQIKKEIYQGICENWLQEE